MRMPGRIVSQGHELARIQRNQGNLRNKNKPPPMHEEEFMREYPPDDPSFGPGLPNHPKDILDPELMR